MRELVKLGVDVHAVMPGNGPLVSSYSDVGVTVHGGQYSLPMKRPHQWPSVLRSFRGLVEDICPDIIHSHFVGTTLTMRLALGKNHPTARVFQVPGPLHLEHSLFRTAEIRTAGGADSWIGSCEWTCGRYHSSGIETDRIHLAYYGVDLEEVVPRMPGALRGELGIGTKAPIVGMVAYMYAPKRYLGQKRGLKGHEDLIDAVATVRRYHPAIQTVFVGGAWAGAIEYEQHVRAYAAKRLGSSAHFLGTRSDIPELYADFDMVVHPSHSENVGGAAESLLLGVPTIATDVGGFPDLVIPGETGWLVPPGNPQKIAESILEGLANPVYAQGMAQRGKQRARQIMDVRSNAADIRKIYEEILGSNV